MFVKRVLLVVVCVFLFSSSHVLSFALDFGSGESISSQEELQNGQPPSFLDNLIDEFGLSREEGELPLLENNSTLLTKDFYIFSSVILLCAIACGAGLTQLTARICPEYFSSSAIPKLFGLTESTNATVLGLVGGITDTLLPSLAISVAVSLAAHLGKLPRLKLYHIAKEFALLSGGVSLVTLLTGIAGLVLHNKKGERAVNVAPRRTILPDHTPNFYASSYAHTAAFIASLLAGAVLVGLILKKRLDLNEDRYKKICAVIVKHHRDLVDHVRDGYERRMIEQERAFKQAAEVLHGVSSQRSAFYR